MTAEQRREQIVKFAMDIRRGVYDKVLAFNHEHWTMKGKSIPVWLRGAATRTEKDRAYMRRYFARRRREDQNPASVCDWRCIDALGARPCPYNKCRRER